MKHKQTSAAAMRAWPRPSRRARTLEDYVREGLLTRVQDRALRKAIAARQNILVGGRGEAGRTTFASALLSVVAESNDRVIVIEQIPQLNCTSANKLEICIQPPELTWHRAVTAAMTFRPDRLVIDEMFDDAARDILLAWQQLAGGLGIVFGEDVPQMLEVVSAYAAGSLPPYATPEGRSLVAQTVHVCVHLRHHDRRRSLSIERVVGFDPSRGFQLEPLGAE